MRALEFVGKGWKDGGEGNLGAAHIYEPHARESDLCAARSPVQTQ